MSIDKRRYAWFAFFHPRQAAKQAHGLLEIAITKDAEIRALLHKLKEFGVPFGIARAIMDDATQKRHEFVGRRDRYCETCGLPDRHPVHTRTEPQ